MYSSSIPLLLFFIIFYYSYLLFFFFSYFSNIYLCIYIDLNRLKENVCWIHLFGHFLLFFLPLFLFLLRLLFFFHT